MNERLLPALANEDFLLLALAANNYRRNHFRIALSARGLVAGRRLLSHFEPDFLFVDIRDFPLPEALAELLQASLRSGCRLIAKRVETPSQVAVALQAGVELVQGYAFDVPQALAGQSLERLASQESEGPPRAVLPPRGAEAVSPLPGGGL